MAVTVISGLLKYIPLFKCRPMLYFRVIKNSRVKLGN